MKKAKKEKPKRKRGRPRKGEEVTKEPSRLESQGNMTLDGMLDDLPKKCDIGCKKNSIRGKSFCSAKTFASNGHTETWIGYKLHIDTADGQVPISCILTSASTHDSQAAIPLAETSCGRVTNLYDLMDSAYDASPIKDKSLSLGHVPLIDQNPRNDKVLREELEAEKKRLDLLHFESPEKIRYRERSAAERVNGRLKDEFGGRNIRVRGHAKVFCHLMFGILVVTADQLMRLAI
ncbi:transposase [Candidatus Marithioploca araucensis]|uniref:Transposase n=1 Tax=Candidatus Marithioploca araucensis TaxID=70273 RepID=A0ABT7VWC2_9GAMM|nr:transposase [Candidatus Marithioploca araucensis]